ncbi:hypothetical protein [Haloferax sp. YSSS75]|uniref:hypothetical protein n=1 Tax=Haloferax sp. YSSS75 TaxID=3388564 RepID=UPI00398D4C1C
MTAVGYPRRWQVLASGMIVVLTAAATISGLLIAGFYSDPPALRLQAYGQDLVTLGIILPVLTVGLWYALRGSTRGYFLWLGAVGYLTYTYLVYAVITQFNWFFLGYVAIFGLSLYTFVAGLLQIDASAVERSLESTLPVRLVVGFFVVMGVLVALLWLSEAVPATLTNTKPESAAAVGLPANVVHVLDLGVVIPAMFVAARWLSQRRAWGYVLAGVLFVKVVSISLAVLGMIGWMLTHGQSVALAEIVVFTVLTLASTGVGVVYFRSFRVVDSEDDGRRTVAPSD